MKALLSANQVTLYLFILKVSVLQWAPNEVWKDQVLKKFFKNVLLTLNVIRPAHSPLLRMLNISVVMYDMRVWHVNYVGMAFFG